MGKFIKLFETTANTLQYSMDRGSTWNTASGNIQVSSGESIMWKGTCTPTTNGIGKFSGSSNVRYDVQGNVMSLLYGDDFEDKTSLVGKDYAFRYLFNGNTNVVNAEDLILPATTLANNCYSYMFSGCTSLTTAELPATTLAQYCYAYMFYGCTNLNYIKCLATNISASNCTRNWVINVGTTGTFVKNKYMSSWTTGISGIPSNWTVVDAS